MRELRSIWRAGGKICLIFGLGLLALYAILGFALGFIGGILAIAGNGAVWTLLGAVFLSVARFGDAKRERLKREGLCFDGEIVCIVPNMLIRVGFFASARADCRYINFENKTCLVQSGLFMIDSTMWTLLLSDGPKNPAALAAKIYVNRNNPRDYYVELREKITGANADYDYR